MKNNTSSFIKSILIVLFAGLLCNFIWLYEILQIKGWHGLNWLDGYLYSTFIIIGLIVLSFILPFRIYIKTSVTHLIIAFVGLYIVSLLSFEMALHYLYSINSKFFGYGLLRSEVILIMLTGILVPNAIYSLGYGFITKKILGKTSWFIFLWFPVIIFLSILFGFFTIQINSGYGNGKGFIDSVKMGYPIFWLNIFGGMTAIIISRKKTKD